jgi:hypothetical protein
MIAVFFEPFFWKALAVAMLYTVGVIWLAVLIARKEQKP